MQWPQANNFFGAFSIFESGGITKPLGKQLGKQRVLFPLDLNVPLGFASGNIEGLGETKLTVSPVASH